jgi:hypothetical protein
VVVSVDEAAGRLTLHVKKTDPAWPVQVVEVPFEPGVANASGCSWRQPPHV